jgi:hypothetical protein
MLQTARPSSVTGKDSGCQRKIVSVYWRATIDLGRTPRALVVVDTHTLKVWGPMSSASFAAYKRAKSLLNNNPVQVPIYTRETLSTPCAQDGWMDEVEAARSKPHGERQNFDLLELQMSSMRKGWMSNPLEAMSETSPANENI